MILKENSSSCISLKGRIIGCCNFIKITDLTPHDIGGYVVQLLSKHPYLQNYQFLYSVNGINNTLIDTRPTSQDLIIIDDITLNLGNLKILRLDRYGLRGHNAIKWYRNKYNIGKHNNPWIVLIGTGPISMSDVNKTMSVEHQNIIKILVLGLYRGFYKWPNNSYMIQITKYFLKIYLSRKEY